MDEATAFHTAVRRYCENEFTRSPRGVVTVRGTGQFGGSSCASPWQFAEAALVEVEKLIPAQFQSMQDLRPLLLHAGDLAQQEIAELEDSETKKGRNRREVYSTSQAFDWLVYAHHESAIGISGEWLEDAFRQQWPDWSDRVYEGPYSTTDLRGTWEPPTAYPSGAWERVTQVVERRPRELLTVGCALEDGTLVTCTGFEYKGAIWFVPKWLSFPEEGYAQPERMIQVDQFRHQKRVRFDPLATTNADFRITDPIPKKLFDGEPSQQLKEQYVVLDRHAIEDDPDLRSQMAGTRG